MYLKLWDNVGKLIVHPSQKFVCLFVCSLGLALPYLYETVE